MKPGPAQVAALMGHKRRGVTSFYTHLFGDAFEGAEEALDAVLGVNEASMDCGVTTEHHRNRSDSDSVADRTAEPILAG